MRDRLLMLIRKAEPGDGLSRFYDWFIVATSFISVMPLMVKETNPILEGIDIITLYILFADYIFRWITYDLAIDKKGARTFMKYPFTPFAIISLASLLPSMGILGQGFRVLRMLRIFTVFHYSRNFRYIADVFRKQKKTLISVLYIALFYIFVSALMMFTYEPDTFHSFFDALYWATTALPAGIVTAGFVEEVNKNAKEFQDFEETKTKWSLSQMKVNITPKVKRYVVIILIGVIMNQGLNLLCQELRLPIWLDTSGTALAAILLEPAAGLLVGLINNLILSVFEFGTGALLYYAVSAAVALIAGLYIKRNGKITALWVVIGILLIIIISSVLAGGVELLVNQGATPTTYWEGIYYTMLQGKGMSHGVSYLLAEGIVKVFDTFATAVVVFIGCLFLGNGCDKKNPKAHA